MSERSERITSNGRSGHGCTRDAMVRPHDWTVHQ